MEPWDWEDKKVVVKEGLIKKWGPQKYELESELEIPQWFGLHDQLYVYKRKENGK